jgi:iron complex transport system permease protein
MIGRGASVLLASPSPPGAGASRSRLPPSAIPPPSSVPCTLRPVPASRRSILTLLALAALLAAAILLRLSLGPAGQIAWPQGEDLAIRLDRVLSGLIVGAALAIGGVMLQSLLRNPLASPDLIGAASGAGLAVTASMLLSGSSVLALSASQGPAALIGSLAALAVVYFLGQRRGFVEPVMLVLIGVMVSIICGAGTMLLGSLMPDGGWAAIRWSMGAISDDVSRQTLAAVGALTLIALAAGLLLGRAMDVASLSEEEARSIGVPIEYLRLALFLLSGALTAGAVLIAGPIGFVGLVCPHIVRLTAGPSHRTLLVGSALAGATLVIAADIAVRLVDLQTGRLPLGIFTALVGGPIFIAMLRRRSTWL